MGELRPLLQGLVFPEGPRWHEGKLWFSDIFDAKIYSLSETGGLSVEVEVDRPSGLGWLPDGSLLVAILAASTRVAMLPALAVGACAVVVEGLRALFVLAYAGELRAEAAVTP